MYKLDCGIFIADLIEKFEYCKFERGIGITDLIVEVHVFV